jgi:hypothetical protein
MKRLTLIVLFSVGLSGTAIGAKKHRKGAIPPLRSGELMLFSAKIGEVKGGTCTVVAKRVRRVRNDLRIKATLKAKTNRFFDKVHKVNNFFSSESMLHDNRWFRYHIDVDQSGSVLKRKVDFRRHRRKGRINYVAHWKKWRNKKYVRTYRRKNNVPKDTYNLVSALYHARFMPYEKGKTYQMHVFATGRMWIVKGRFVRKTKIYTIFGARKALLIHATAKRTYKKAKPKHIKVWLSDDALRIPYRIRGHVPFIGTATGELIGYRRSARSRYLDGNTRRKKRRRGGKVWSFLSNF